MAKNIYNNPIDKNINWGGDSNTGGWPVSGEMVQKFIKDTFASKFGYSRIVDNKEQFFEDEVSASLYDENPTLNSKLLLHEIDLPSGSGDGMQYYVRAVNNLDTRNFATSVGKNCYIDFTFISQYRDGSESSYENTGERGMVQLFVRTSDSEYVLIREFYCNSNVSNKIEVSSLLVSGENDIMIRIVGEETQQAAPALVYTITLTSLSLSANNFDWQTTFKEDIVIPFNIGGNVNKNLFITVTGDDYIARYEVSLGKTTYLETAYNYTIPHPGKAGVFNIAAYVQNSEETITTDTVQFNVVCSVIGDTSKFITINNVTSKVTNWSDNKLFSYSVYDGGNTKTSLTFRVEKNGVVISENVNDAIVTEKVNTFNLPLEIETIDNENFTIVVYISDENGVLETIEFLVDNSLGYSASSGAALYINPKTRNNTQSNYEFVVNEMDGSEIQTTWTNVGWGVDGWTTDNFGNKILRLISGSTATINYQPFYVEPARTGKTIEIDFSINNVSDYETMVINMSSGGTSPIGIQIYPEEVAVYSQILKTKDVQNANLKDNDRVKMSIVLMPNAYGNSNFNLAIIYINGVKNREFTYESNDYFQNAGKIVLGCTGADLDIYGMRVYDFALTTAGVLRNLINWESSTEKREDITYRNDVLDVDGYEVDYNKVQPKFNVFVWEGEVPSLSNPNDFTGNLRVLWKDNPSWNSYVKNVTCGGQGTSSMKYWMWNLRWKVGSSTVVEYNDGSSTTGSWQFVPGQPAIKRGTAKLNWASSMQSHKMGSVNSINDLAEELGITNEANARISIYQYPFVGFQKTVNEDGEDVYKFIGLYTFGPDKGDDNTFGYDTSKYPNLLSLEGSDNAPLPALFRVPWNKNTDRIVYNSTEEAFQYNGVNCWDFNAGSLDKIDPWINAYNFVYECSPRLQAYEGTLDQINANKATYKDIPNEFWLTSGDVVYYEPSVGEFIYSDTGNGTINLITQLVDKGYGLTSSDLTDKTSAEKTQLFIKARIEKFRLEMQQYWDLDDAIFQRNWVEFNAATDNRAKNTYPYTFGGTFRWRSDDTDTIGPITNQGQSKKGYYVEIGDSYDNGQPVWNGATSNFWNLIDLAFEEEVILGMRSMMTAMEKLSGKLTGTSVEKIYAFYKKYYFDMAQEYFSETLYNMAAKTLYESAKIAYNNGTYTNDTDPITQSLGDHYAAERRWFSKRIIYMMSKYSYGEFSADGTDNITVRAAGNTITYELTPATHMYPTIVNGTSVVKGERTEAGETCIMEIELGGSADQQNIIQGASYLKDIGQWYNRNVTGEMIVKGKMLTELNLGHSTEPITISINKLTIQDCPSLNKILLSRISTLSGTLDVSECFRLEQIYIDGTSLIQTIFPSGGSLKTVVFGSENKYINFQNLPLLTNSGVDVSLCKTKITDFLISNCKNLNGISLLYSIWSSQKSLENPPLKRIRCVGINETAANETIDMLYLLATGNYNGLDANGIGINGLPVFEGNLHVTGAVKRTVDYIMSVFPQLKITYDNEIIPSGFTINITSKDSFTENETIQLTSSSTNDAYSEVEWIIYDYGTYYNNDNIKLDKETGVITLLDLITNISFSRTITIQARSVYNNAIYARKTITIAGTKISGLTIEGDDVFSFGEDGKLSFNITPTTHTKPTDLVIEATKDGTVSVDNEGNLIVLTEGTELVTLNVCLALDNSIEASKSILVNDAAIATQETNAELVRIAYSNGWCASDTQLMASEAMKVTDVGSSFKNNIVIESLDELQYFGLTTIGSNAFAGCTSLRSIIFPSFDNERKYVTSLFENCSNLERVDLSKIKNLILASYCISCTDKLTDIILPYGVYLARSCFNFSGYTPIPTFNTIDLRGGKIENDAFHRSGSGNSVRYNFSIGEFIIDSNIPSLNVVPKVSILRMEEGVTEHPTLWPTQKYYIPASLTTWKNSTNQSVRGVEVEIASNSSFVLTEEKVLLDTATKTVLAALGEQETTYNYNIPADYTNIEEAAFFCCNNYTVVLHDNIQKIGNSAFRGNNSTTTNVVCNSLGCDIGEYVFQYANIQAENNSLEFREGVTTIGSYAFYRSSGLDRITLPSTLTIIETYAFYACKSIKEILSLNPVAPSVGSSAFTSVGENTSTTGENKLWIPVGATGYDTGYWLNPLQNSPYCGFTLEYLYTPQECTSLTITADDVRGWITTTTIYYTAITNGVDTRTGETMMGVEVTGTATSEAFGQNTSYTDTVEREVSFTYLGVTATTTITQGVWVDRSYTLDLNDQWQASTVANPDSTLYDGVYESFSNYNVGSTAAIMYIDITGYETFRFYVRSYGESSYDYVVVSNLDCTLTNDTTSGDNVKLTTKGKATSGTATSNYTLVEFTGVDGGEHRITVMYRKDSSGDNGDDKGYVLIPKDQE